MKTEEIKSILSKIQLFSFLEGETLDELAKKCAMERYATSKSVVKKGDEGTHFYIIYSGHAKVIDTVNGDEVVLAQLQKGDFFGERSLLKGDKVSSTIKAEGELVTLELSKADFTGIIEQNSDMKQYVQNFLFNRAVYNFLRKFSVFGELNSKDVADWLRALKYENVFKDGEYVFKKGDLPDKFYVIVQGKADVVINDEVVATLKEGQFFGELAIINNKPRAASIRAQGQLKLVSLSKQKFKEMVSQNPALEEKMNNIIEMYNLDPETAKEISSVPQELEEQFDAAAIDAQVLVQGEPWDAKPRRSFFSRVTKSYPFVEQYDARDTASACISMICKYYGKHIGLSRIKDLANVTENVKSITDVSYAAEMLGFASKPIQMQLDDFKKLTRPVIALMKKNKFFVIYEADGKNIRLADPSQGLITVTHEEFAKAYEGFVLTMQPTTKLEGVEDAKMTSARFFMVLAPYKKIMGEIFLVSLLVSLFGLAPIIFMRLVVDTILVHQDESLLNSMLIGMVVVGLFLGFSVMLKAYLTTYLGNKVQMEMLGQFFSHVLSQPAKFFADRKTGDIMSRFNETSRVQHMLAGSGIELFVDVIMVSVYVVAMFSFNVNLAFVVLGFILLTAVTMFVFTSKLKKISQESSVKAAATDALLVETIGGAQTIKAMSSEIQARWKWEEIFTESLKLRSRTATINSVQSAVSQSLRMFALIIVLWYGSVLVMADEMSVGQVMAFNMLVLLSMGPIQKLMGMWGQIQETSVSMDRINDIYDMKPEEKLRADNIMHMPPIEGNVKFEKVSFAYNRQTGYILKNVEFEVQAGQKVAIVGRSGSGKSSLINLLLRFYDPTAGTITIDGYNTQHMSIASLRKQIGTVLQESFLFNGTIRENIALGKPDATFAEVIEAATLAAAHEFIKELPQGYNTMIGERGGGLSGGQKQRLTIARALLMNPRILIFDEATSALDNESEKAIQDNLMTICEGRTVFIIAHRLSTVRDADVIIVMDKGYVAEMGTHDELMEKEGIYFYLNSKSLELS